MSATAKIILSILALAGVIAFILFTGDEGVANKSINNRNKTIEENFNNAFK